MRQNSGLIIVDTQENMFDPSFSVYDGTRILKTIGELLEQARKSQTAVIYVRNNGLQGEPDEPNTPGWHLHPVVAPEPGELIIDKHGVDPFADTNFQAELDHREIAHLIVVGMQTEMCVAATVRQATRLGYTVTLVGDGHTTFDWDGISAVEAIAQHNQTLAQVADVRHADAVVFN